MSKALYLTMIAILMAALIAGCGDNPTDTAAPASDNSQPTAYPAQEAIPTSTVSSPGTPVPAAAATGYPAASAGILRVTSATGQGKPLSIADLGQLAKGVVGVESGPTVGDVLLLAGIKDFSSITVTGSNGSLELAKAKVTDQVVISLDNNTFTLVVGGTPKEQWIKDLSTIAVK